jgi:hypothetical protein
VSGVKRIREIMGLVGLVFGAVGAVRELREARGKRDGLKLLNAAFNFAAVLTGGALIFRSLRDKDGDS